MEALAKTCIPEGIGKGSSFPPPLNGDVLLALTRAWDVLFPTNRREGSCMGIHAAMWVDVGVGACGSFCVITSIFSVK